MEQELCCLGFRNSDWISRVKSLRVLPVARVWRELWFYTHFCFFTEQNLATDKVKIDG